MCGMVYIFLFICLKKELIIIFYKKSNYTHIRKLMIYKVCVGDGVGGKGGTNYYLIRTHSVRK